MLPFQYQRFCLVESLTVIQNPHLMTSDSSGELDGHDANEQQMVLLLMIQYSGHRNSKWFRPHAQLDHHDTMWIRAQWPQYMKYVAWCTAAACINQPGQVLRCNGAGKMMGEPIHHLFFLTVIKISHQLENWIYSCRQNWTINSRGLDFCSYIL